MAIKIYDVPGVGQVRFQKRRGTRHIRISLSPQGDIRVSLPAWAPYNIGLEFVKNKQAWIQQHHVMPALLVQRQAIGKAHRLEFIASRNAQRPSSRLRSNTVRVTHPVSLEPASSSVQQTARRGAIKALQAEAEALLPGRLAALAQTHGFTYRSLRIKHLRSKWGSCSHRQEITLNAFLMTLPWQLIDYVLVHELVHTKVLRHGEPFWTEMKQHMPRVQELRRQLKQHQPTFSNT